MVYSKTYSYFLLVVLQGIRLNIEFLINSVRIQQNTHDGILSLFFVAAAANGFRCLLRCFTACIIAIFMPTSFLRLKSVFFRPDDIFFGIQKMTALFRKLSNFSPLTDRFPFHFSGMPIPDSDIPSE